MRWFPLESVSAKRNNVGESERPCEPWLEQHLEKTNQMETENVQSEARADGAEVKNPPCLSAGSRGNWPGAKVHEKRLTTEVQALR